MHLLKHSQDGHRVHSGDQAAEQEKVQQSDVQVPCETAAPSASALRGLERMRTSEPGAWGLGGLPRTAALLAARLEASQDGDLESLSTGPGRL